MIVSTKHGDIRIVVEHDSMSKGFYLEAKTEHGTKMGSLTFSVEKDKNQTWLNVVETENGYKHRGVGTALLTAMEFISERKFGISQIIGTFMPYEKTRRNPFKPVNKPKIKKFTKRFYEVNGYNVNMHTSILEKPLIKKQKDYSKLVDCSYAEFMSFGIDYDAMEELQR